MSYLKNWSFSLESMKPTVRFGRVPKREKAKILAAMQSVNARSQEKALAVELEDEAKLVHTIVTAHDETCDYTKDKIGPLIQTAREHPVYTQCTPQLACPLNPNPHPLQNGNQRVLEDFSERFSPAIRGVVEFAKRIPGFSLLSQDDQVTLLKAGVFEVLLVRLACMFDSRSNTMICLNGQVLKRESLQHTSNARFLMDSMFDFADRLNTLQLMDSELGLFCAVVVIAADRPGLRNVELVEKMQDKLMQALQASVSQGHPQAPGFFQELMKKIPDLRTLNTLHSEKLLAFKMEPHAEAAPHQQAEVAASTNMHALYQTHVGHWGTYGMARQSPHAAPSEDSKGSWEEQEHLVPSHLLRGGGGGGGGVEAMAWSPSGADAKDQDLYCSPRSSEAGSFVIDDGSSVKSPLGSVSSGKGVDGESVCSGEMAHLVEQHGKRRKELHHEGCGSSGDESSAVESPGGGKCPYKVRKLESPTDSGIESGKDLGSSGSSGSRSTSICSSPRSSMDDKVKDISDCEASEKMESIEDMPVLKRALQAPPLINTNLLMDEAYKPHKKFRALRKDSDSTPTSPDIVAAAPAASVSPHCPPAAALGASLASSHSMLVKTLEQGPRMSEQQLKRTDIIRNIIMRSEGGQGAAQAQAQAQQHAYGVMYALPQGSPQQGGYPAPSGKAVCPPGYYIPQPNASIGTTYPAASSWSTFVSAASPPTTAASPTRPSYVPVSSGMQLPLAASPPQQQQHSHYQPQPQQAASPASATSPLPRMYYNPRGSASASPTLAISPLPPMAAAVVGQACKRASPKPTSPMAGQIVEHLGGGRGHGESQPLNLSKKLMASPPPPLQQQQQQHQQHHMASLHAMERTAHLQRVKLEAS